MASHATFYYVITTESVSCLNIDKLCLNIDKLFYAILSP